jgi:hypothetical protein
MLTRGRDRARETRWALPRTILFRPFRTSENDAIADIRLLLRTTDSGPAVIVKWRYCERTRTRSRCQPASGAAYACLFGLR